MGETHPPTSPGSAVPSCGRAGTATFHSAAAVASRTGKSLLKERQSAQSAAEGSQPAA